MAQSDKEVLNLFQLIGAPLLAVVQAEAQAAQVSADFIKDVGFEHERPLPVPGAAAGAPAPAGASAIQTLQDGGDLGDLKMVQFKHQVRGTDGVLRTHQMNVPVLSLFPIPLLQVKHAEFDFAIRILDHQSRGAADSAHRDHLEFLSKQRMELKGTIGRQQTPASTQRSTDLQLNVRIRMEQADIPAGLSKLLTILDQGITSSPAAAAPPSSSGSAATPVSAPPVQGTTG